MQKCEACIIIAFLVIITYTYKYKMYTFIGAVGWLFLYLLPYQLHRLFNIQQ